MGKVFFPGLFQISEFNGSQPFHWIVHFKCLFIQKIINWNDKMNQNIQKDEIEVNSKSKGL